MRWIQITVNRFPHLINGPMREACGLPAPASIEWVSPLERDEFAEYRDQAFLDCLGVGLMKRPLRAFWPGRGPQWDALARSDRGEVFLVESKAHVAELLSPGTKASTQSRALISASLKEMQSFLRVNAALDWSGTLYQYANRLAHLYLLRELNGLQAFLIFLYFVGDEEMDGPSTPAEWKSAIKVMKAMLGLNDHHRLSRYVVDLFVNVADIRQGNVGQR